MPEKEPFVSICIPAYNSGKYILKTIDSIFAQTWKNLEVVVVDDASTDDTAQVLQSVKDSRFRLIQNEENLGMTANWNKCVRSCRGEYVKLIPADDILYPTCIEKSMRILMNHPEVSLVVTGSDLINDRDEITGKYCHWPKRGIIDGRKIAKASVMWNNFYGNPVCALFRKEDFEKTGGFDEDIPYILDFDLWLGLSRFGKIANEPELLNAFRVRKDSNTGRLVGKGGRKYTEEHIRLIDKHRKLGTYSMNSFERLVSIAWRWIRNFIIAGVVLISNKE